MTRSRFHIRTAVVTIAAVLLAMPAAELAGAHELNARSKVTIDSGGPSGAEGRVTSKRSVCERARKVILFLVTQEGNQRIGSDRTNRSGRWRVDASLYAGEYFAKAVMLSWRQSAAHRHRCRAVRSVRLRL